MRCTHPDRRSLIEPAYLRGLLVAAGLRTRVESALRPVPVLVRERVAMLALVSGTALSVLCLVRGELPWPTQVTLPQQGWRAIPHLGPFTSTAVVLYSAWLAAVAAAVAGSAVAYRAARVLLVVITATVLVVNGIGRMLALPVAPLHLIALFTGLAALTLLGRVPISLGRGVVFGSGGLAVLLFVVDGNTAGVRLPLIVMAAGGLLAGVALLAFRAGIRQVAPATGSREPGARDGRNGP